MRALPVYILAGGESSRFGSDKARAVVEGQPLIVHIAQRAQPFASRLTVVAQRDGQYADLDLRTIADAVPKRGPLGGLFTALRDLPPEEEWLCLLSCDLLRVETAWIETLWQHRAGARAVAFRGDDFWQPMLALYHRVALDEVARRVTGDDRSMQGLLRALGCVAAPLPADWPRRLQANTPGELRGEEPRMDTDRHG